MSRGVQIVRYAVDGLFGGLSWIWSLTIGLAATYSLWIGVVTCEGINLMSFGLAIAWVVGLGLGRLLRNGLLRLTL